MEPEERDELLYRLDERSVNTYHLVEKLEQYQNIQNNRVEKLTGAVSKNTAFRRTGIAIFTAAIGVLISKIQGLW